MGVTSQKGVTAVYLAAAVYLIRHRRLLIIYIYIYAYIYIERETLDSLMNRTNPYEVFQSMFARA